MGGKKPLRRPLWPPTRATASNYYPLGLDGAGGAAKPLLRAPKKPAPLHGRLPAFSGAVDAFERARKCFLEWRYFFSIILSEFLKNRVALHPFFSLEQALYAIQMLDPPGIGARSLSECLILQLVQSRSLDPLTIGIARNGLEQLGRRDYKGLAAMLGAGVSEIKQASAKILALEPIPSRSFASSEPIAYIVPDAAFSVEQSRVTIELNRRVLPRLSVNTEYSALLATSDDPNVQQYVREKLTEANAIIKGVHMRCNTILRLLTLIATEQHDFFCSGGTLTPITMQQMAEKMDMSTSTVSRAIQNKYIQYRGRIVPLRSFFTTAIRSDASVSSQAVRQRIQDLIKTENPEAPLSDESVRIALSALGIEVSRRAVAKYRMALDIPPSSQRKKR